MNPITHLLIGWELGSAMSSSPRERAAIAWASVAADADGLGALVDVGNRVLGRPETSWFGAYHHVLFHGLFGAVLAAGVAAAVCRRRGLAAVGAFLAVHVHLLCDLAGSRGPSPGDVWPISYLAPFSEALTVSWPGQWPLNGWPNVLITLLLLAVVLVQAGRGGVSPVSLFSRRADAAFVAAVRRRGVT
jgi:inner membrane protein